MFKSSSDLTHGLLTAIVTERGVLAMLVASQTLAILLAFSPMSFESIWVRLGIISLFVHCVSAVGFTLLYFSRTYLKQSSELTEYLLVIIVFQFITFLMSLGTSVFELSSSRLLDWSFIAKNSAICLFVTLLFLHFMTIFRDKLSTVATLSRLELDALHARIRPHFLYNSLNTIAELTQQDPDAAEQAVLTLANLSQWALYPHKLVTLADELTIVRKYLALEHWRFGSRMQVKWSVPTDIPDILVPVLIVQPLVENAVNYGVESDIQGGCIEISVQVTSENVTIMVKNSLCDDTNKRQGQGIAQRNIRARLALHYNGAATLTTKQTKAHYFASVVLPNVEQT